MLDRRKFLEQNALYALLLSRPLAQAVEKTPEAGRTPSAPQPIPEPHFPTRLHQFVWRNWELTNTERMAQILETSADNVLALGESMGLPAKVALTPDQLRRIYVTVIRQNWHLLPDEQLIGLLGWTRAGYDYHLKEDDFLWIKLGSRKPLCEKLIYRPITAQEAARAGEIKALVDRVFGKLLHQPTEAPFQFVQELSELSKPIRRPIRTRPAADEIDLRTGWSLGPPTDGVREDCNAAGSFADYVKAAFNADIHTGASLGSGSRRIRFAIDSNLTGPTGGFRISVGADSIRVMATDGENLRNATYELENLMEERQGPYLPVGDIQRTPRFSPRYVYSYFALYGDPLMEEDIDPFPDGLLEKLSRAGINGVWLQAILRNLAPSTVFPEFGEGWETRLRNLNKLIQRAGRYGVKVYLYINEPRSMTPEFFRNHPEARGAHDLADEHYYAMCTSSKDVRRWLADSMAHLFSNAAGLGGIFCITASENLTNCFSHGHPEFCPRCSQRDGSDVIAEVLETFRRGVRRGSATADVIAWDWGWGKDWVRNCCETEKVIAKLSPDVALLSVSEWGKGIERGGFPAKVGEYSVSVPGPGPRAVMNWQLAQDHKNPAFAKVQWDNSWEISAVPYIPVPHLVLKHCQELVKANVQGLMVSWTVGGCPSPNFEVVKELYFAPSSNSEEILRQVANRRYGRAAANDALAAWEAFSHAFSEYPMDGGGLVYRIPVQHGPANPLRLHPTGYKATMMLFPYDDWTAWAGPYPTEVVESQFAKMAREWQAGLESLRKVLVATGADRRESVQKEVGIAETCYLHFQSVANQMAFYRWRKQWASAAEESSRRQFAEEMVKIATQELEVARRQYAVAKRDSMIAYEASNHYYYRPLALVEKVLNCQYVIDELANSSSNAAGAGRG